MIANYGILGITLVLLLYASIKDLETHTVKSWVIYALWGLGIWYILSGGFNLLSVFEVLMFLIFIFTIPCFFSFGLGDFFVITGIGLFLENEAGMQLFLFLFLVTWGIWTGYHLLYNRPANIPIKKLIFTAEFPLIPVLFLSFVLWVTLTLLSRACACA